MAEFKSRINEIRCIELDIKAPNQGVLLTAKFGYIADGVKCGEVSMTNYANLIDSSIELSVRNLLEQLENNFAKQFGEVSDAPSKREITGLVKDF
tara:strand:+ start:487 stop:771 length:285 start_codon:yes stop_codon:yes gene_type:complete